MSEGPKSSDDGGFSKYVVDDSSAAVNNNPNVKLHAELVNNTGCLKSEAQLGFVHSKEDGEGEEQLPDLYIYAGTQTKKTIISTTDGNSIR